jgi:hypothetical protein
VLRDATHHRGAGGIGQAFELRERVGRFLAARLSDDALDQQSPFLSHTLDFTRRFHRHLRARQFAVGSSAEERLSCFEIGTFPAESLPLS